VQQPGYCASSSFLRDTRTPAACPLPSGGSLTSHGRLFIDLSWSVNFLPLIFSPGGIARRAAGSSERVEPGESAEVRSAEGIGSTHGNAAFVTVAERTLQIRVAPWCARRRIRIARRRIARRRSGPDSRRHRACSGRQD
jgi:hypothetical protein